MEKKDKVEKITELTKEELESLFSKAVKSAKEKSHRSGKTTCEYDKEKGEAYLLHPDGSREYYDGKRLKTVKIASVGKSPIKRVALKISNNAPNQNTVPNNKRIDNKTRSQVVKRNG